MKNQLTEWSQITINSFQHFWATIAEQIPSIIGAILLLLIGWIVAKIISAVVRKLLNTLKLDKLKSMINDSKMVQNAELEINPVQVVSKFVYWLVLIFFFVVAADVMHWNIVSQEIGGLFRYLPQLLIALVIFVIGMYIANFVRKVLSTSFKSMSFVGGEVVSSVVYYIILIIVTITALNQAGIDTQIISGNLNIILGSVLFAFALGFGLASKELIRKILFSFYSSGTFEEGQTIRFEDVEGVIVAITNMSVTIQTEGGEEIIPINIFMNSRVKILS